MKIMTKRFLVAVCLLVVSATLLGSASFAWFSMNTEVGVDGIEVEAYSDALFLEIASENTDSAFDISTTLTEGKKALRLVTNAFIADEDIVKITVTPVIGRYDGTANVKYYVKADSDVTDTTYGANDGKDNYVLATDLEKPTSTTGLYKIAFVKNAYDKTFTEGDTTVYYAKDLTTNSFTVVTGLVAGESLAAYYTATIEEQDAAAVYDGVSTYFSYDASTSTYTIVGDLELGTVLNDKYYSIVDKAYTEADTGDEAPYYYVKNAKGEYSCLGLAITEELDTYPEFYWGRAYANALGEVQASNTLNVIDLNGNDNDYFYYDTIYLRSAENTNPGQNLQIAEVKVGGRTNELSAALRILFVATNGKGEVKYLTYDNGTGLITVRGSSDPAAANAPLFDTILGDRGEVVTVEMYVYFDGTDDVSLTKKDAEAGILNGQTVEIKFTIDGPDYN